MKRLVAIDGIRGIAILMVVSFHYLNVQLVNSTSTIGKIFSKATYFGWVGVDLFFVLSGFLIGTILLKNKTSKNYFSTFYIRRIVRIIPNYYLLLIIYIVINFFEVFKNDYNLTGNNVIPIWSYFLMVHNFFMAHINNLGNESIVITWSIGIEEQFYLLIPFVLYKMNSRFLPWFVGLIIIISILIRFQYDTWIPKYVLLGCRADSIAFGLLISWVYLYRKVEKINYNLLVLSFIILITIVGFIYMIYDDLGVFKHSLFAAIFSILILMALVNKNNFYNKFLENKILCWIGKLSYSLYLFHYLILHLVQFVFGRHRINNIEDVFIIFLAFLISILFSFFVYQYLEQPMIKIGKKYNY